jgi:S-layer protein
MSAVNVQAADNSVTFEGTISGFERLTISDAVALNTAATINLANLDGLNYVTFAGSADDTNANVQTFNNFATGGTLVYTAFADADHDSTVASVAGAALGTADVFNVGIDSTAIVATGSLTVADVETINISSADATTTATAGVFGAAVINTMTLAATSATAINVSGNNGLNLTGTTNTAVTTFNASGVVGNDAIATDTAANLAVTFTSANTTATATVTITGGEGNDTLTSVATLDVVDGGAGADTIDTGAGIDTIVGGAGADNIDAGTGADIVTGGAGRDEFLVAAGDSTVAAFDTITDFTMATAVTAANNAGYANANAWQAATVGGANADVLDLVTAAVEGNVTAAAGVAVGVTVTIASGMMTIGGGSASSIDTLAEFVAEIEGLSTNDSVAGFVLSGDTYIYDAQSNDLLHLDGISASAISLTTATAAIVADTVMII